MALLHHRPITAIGAKHSALERAVRSVSLRQFGRNGRREEGLRDCARRQGRLRIPSAPAAGGAKALIHSRWPQGPAGLFPLQALT